MHESIIRIKAVSEAIRDIKQEVVFVGGATVSLYASERFKQNLDIRPTDDVDLVIELASYGDYSRLDGKLRSIGFRNDVLSGVICRYKIHGVTVDIMPTDQETLGFNNRWYPSGFETAITVKLDEQTKVKIFNPVYFMAAKMEAFLDRGKDDFYGSSDLEDMVFVIEHMDDFAEQMKAAPGDVFQFLQNSFKELIDRTTFQDALYGHSEHGYDSGSVEHINEVLRSVFDIPPQYRGYSR